jgi:hypothetical protein
MLLVLLSHKCRYCTLIAGCLKSNLLDLSSYMLLLVQYYVLVDRRCQDSADNIFPTSGICYKLWMSKEVNCD